MVRAKSDRDPTSDGNLDCDPEVTQKTGRGGFPEAQGLRDLKGALGVPDIATELLPKGTFRGNPLSTASSGPSRA